MGVFAGKAKTFPYHVDGLAYYPDMEAVTRELTDIESKDTDSGKMALSVHGSLKERADPYSLYHKVPASFNDPISVYFVLDVIVNSQRGIYLRPAYVTAFLREHIGQFYWSTGVVGRIMAGLSTVCADVYLNEQPEGEYLVTERGPRKDGAAVAFDEEDLYHHVPFANGRDSHGRYYVLDPQGGNEGLLWLLQARKLFLQEARQSMRDDGVGRNRDNWGNENSAADYYAQHLGAPARSGIAFKNQLQGGAMPFPPRTQAANRMRFDGS
jgi:hypothetical protein